MLEPDLQVRHRAIAEWLAQDRAALLARTGACWTATASQRAAQLNRVGHHRVSPALGSGLFARVKVVTRTANIKAASFWRGGNSAAVRALFMITNIWGWSSLTAHEKNLTSGHRVC